MVARLCHHIRGLSECTWARWVTWAAWHNWVGRHVCHHKTSPPLCDLLPRVNNKKSFWYIGVFDCGKKPFQLHNTIHCGHTSLHLVGQLVKKKLLSKGTDLLSRHSFRFQPGKSLDYTGARRPMHTPSRKDSTRAVGLRDRRALCVDALLGQVSV